MTETCGRSALAPEPNALAPRTGRPLKVYLAGPDVFRPEVLAWAAAARALCFERGVVPLLPLDGTETTAEGIYRNNLGLIREADAILANLNPFRGFEPDSGTCVEVGMALALGKPVIAYLTDTSPLLERMVHSEQTPPGLDENGWTVEDFGLPLNLMLAIPATIVPGGLPEALDALLAQPM